MIEPVASLDFKFDCSGVDWKVVSETLKEVGMAYKEPTLHQTAFANSFVTVFVRQGSQLIGFGRALSDGAYQAAIYDVAIVPEFQGKGVGTAIMRSILDRLPQCNVILYASIGKEGFYETLGFRKMKTGMAFFVKAEEMKKKGFTE
jgi:ribosomal protein S18 acetylase RimI-like enzyme